jgi:hypothetical protein
MAMAGASAQEAANDFERLVNDSLALRATINANSSAFDTTFTSGYEKYLQSLERFGKSLSPKFSLVSAPVYPFKLISSAIWLRWYSTDNFNAIQKYRSIYVDYWNKAQAMLGAAPTAQGPEKPKAQQRPFMEEAGQVILYGGLGLAALWVVLSTRKG